VRICIFVDMEGISGVSGSDFVRTDGRLYGSALKYYTQELNVCAQACFKAGADAVLARDGHGSGNHMLWDELDARVELIQGATGPVRLPEISECDALILLGYHAMAGTAGALLEHTYSSASIQNMWLNGRPVGEVGIDAAVAGDYGVPTILVTGDDYVCREAQDWIPGVVTCEVKKGLGCQAARLLSRPEAHRRLEAATIDAIQRRGQIPPLRVPHPVTLRTEVMERCAIPVGHLGVRILDGRTYEKTAATVEEAFFV
jgi:D-amino peptidase